MRVAKTKALISFAVTAKLICVFVFAYADCWFSHGAAHFSPDTFENRRSHVKICTIMFIHDATKLFPVLINMRHMPKWSVIDNLQ